MNRLILFVLLIFLGLVPGCITIGGQEALPVYIANPDDIKGAAGAAGPQGADGVVTGNVSDVTASAPLASTGGSTPDISISTAGAATNGALTSADWNTFNNKVDSANVTSNSTAFLIPAADAAGKLDPAWIPAGAGVADHSHTADNITGGTDNQSLLSVSGIGVWTSLLMDHITGLVDALAVRLHTDNVSTVPAAGKVPESDANKVIDSAWMPRTVQIVITADNTTLQTTDNFTWVVPLLFNGWNLISADAGVTTVSSVGTPTFNIQNLTDAADMLSTDITIDATEYTSYTAAAGEGINGAADDVATGDRLQFTCSVTGTGTKGWQMIMVFRKP